MHQTRPGYERLASSYRDNKPCECVQKNNGSFNLCYKVVFDDGIAWAVRFAVPGRVMYPEEKVRREVAVMKFLKEKTRVPIANIVAHGTAMDDGDTIGPFVITEWIEGVSLTSVMEQLPRPEWGPVLREDLDDDFLYKIYRQMAHILLELSFHDFDKIGSLSATEDEDLSSSWSITSRPMTLKVNEIERAGNVITDDHALAPFGTTTEFMNNLVRQNIEHLNKQRNSIDDAEDARRKYILRQRVKELVPHFVSKKFDAGPFKPYCEDIRPGNVLIDENTLQITGVIDWEWTYAAPYQFLFSPPPWLVVGDPIAWTTRCEELYKERFPLFIRALQDAEEGAEQVRAMPMEQRMSSLMLHSYTSGQFWFVQLLQQAFMFDEEVLWPNIETVLKEKGLNELGIPSPSDIAAFVQMKMRHLDQYNKEKDELGIGLCGFDD